MFHSRASVFSSVGAILYFYEEEPPDSVLKFGPGFTLALTNPDFNRNQGLI
jgi:hypothetical protein